MEFARPDALGIRVLPVPRRADGPDLEVTACCWAVHAPELFVSESVLHNPRAIASRGAARRLPWLSGRGG